jgi:peptidyl-prolyl cis-trans isomerase A (cyclophilin A)
MLTTGAAFSGSLGDPAGLSEEAPAVYNVKFTTSKGDFTLEVTRDLAPKGADRFYNLVKNGYYDDTAFFRVVPNFVVQFGLHGDPAVSKAWKDARIKDDPVKGHNEPGTITFAMAGPNTRTTQVFINLRDNRRLDGMGFSPFGKVTAGMEVVQTLYNGYGDNEGPRQDKIILEGNDYIKSGFPKVDWIKTATLAETAAAD